MKFEHFLGTDICDDVEQIKDILSKQSEKGYNEFWISTEKQFPYMAALTKDQLAYVHFFDEEDSPGLCGLAEKNETELDPDEMTIFYSNNESEQMGVENCCVIPLSKAIAVIEEFFKTNELPEIIEWDSL